MHDGGPALPSAFANEKGMSLRDYFAAAALPGLTAQNAALPSLMALNEAMIKEGLEASTNAAIAKAAYGIADAMIAQRQKG